MNIRKAADVAQYGTPNAAQLERINAFSQAQLGAEQVFVFSVRLCDDAIDRDYERFDTQALPALAALFVGKTGVVDHNWSSEKQVARIFDTQVQQENGVSYIKAWAYALREGNEAFLRDIEGGIKKEVSVGCAMGCAHCSVCGEPYGSCAHQKGREYDGKLCVAVLSDPTDAYEFSFVAVPAQPLAGVVKGWKGGEDVHLKELALHAGEAAQKELAALEQQAALGRAYGAQLKSEVLRLSVALGLEAEKTLMQSAVEKLSPEELQGLQAALEKKAAERYAPVTQLPVGAAAQDQTFENEYLI